jgi:hypothetical protein
MYPISNAVKALFESEQRQIFRITGTDKNGTAINITDADVVIDSFNIDRYSCNGEKLEIGTAIAAEMTLKLDNHDGRFNGIVFEGTELFVEIGIADWAQSNPTVNWIPCGYFTPDEQPRSLNIITIHALDRMMQFDATMPTLTPWVTKGGEYVTDSHGNIIYFVSNVRFPVTVQNLVKRVAMLCGVPFTQSLTSLPNYNYTISALPTLQQEITFRNLIQWCAGIMGANAWIDWTGSLRFSWYGATTGYTSTTANRFSSDLHEDNITITGVQYTNTQNVTIVSGSADYAIDMTGNYLAAVGISTILPNVKNKINGFTYRPFTASAINAPYLWPMDMITFAKDGVNYTCALTNVNFGINGTTELQSKGETAQSNSGTKPSGATTEQARLIEQAYEVANNLDKSLDQEGIFNRLTNNGEAQGIYIIDGQVYVNMSYARSGTLILGGLNNQNGLLKVLDASGNETGEWGEDGIDIKAGKFSALNRYNDTHYSAAYLAQSYSSPFRVEYMTHPTVYGNVEITDESLNISQHLPSSVCETSINGSNITMTGERLVQNDSFPDIRLFDKTESTEYNCLLSPKLFRMYSLYDSTMDSLLSASFLTRDISMRGNLTVQSGYTKNKVVSTDQYSERLLYCYETTSPMYGDIGEGVIGDDGKCFVWFDPIFSQTITTTQYQVFLQRYGSGECWVAERKGSYFVVEGTPNMAFGWEIKAEQADISQQRLKRNDEPFTVPKQTYGEGAAKHIEDIRKERESA